MNIADLRRSYTQQTLDEADTHPNPFAQFEQWFQEALNSQLLEPNAMSLATVDSAGQPSARIVLLKGFDEQGFVFFTNYESYKGQALAHQPKAGLLFAWLELERQIRIDGSVEKITEAESEAYFQSRPRGSQVGAWTSPQSHPLRKRADLDTRQEAVEAVFQGLDKLPLPPFWGGYRVLPTVFEFWQGRESRLHDRIQYVLRDGAWERRRLAP
jgi:pyridoxamine 5'-phosphate oxidase